MAYFKELEINKVRKMMSLFFIHTRRKTQTMPKHRRVFSTQNEGKRSHQVRRVLFSKFLIFIKILFCGLLLLATISVPAQEGNNPFDIKTRKKETVEEQVPIIPPVEEIIDTTPITSDPSENNLEPEPTTTNSNNPFNIQPRTNAKKNKTQPKQEKKKPVTSNPVVKNKFTPINDNFRFWMITLMLIILTFTVTLYGTYISKVYRAFINENFLKMIQRDQGTVAVIPYFFLYGLFFISLGIFLFLIFQYFEISIFPTNLLGLLSYIGVIAGVFLIKHLLLNIIGYVFPATKETRQYSFTITIFSIIIGLLLIPANVLIAYAPPGMTKGIIYGTFVAIALVYLFRVLRSLFIASRLITLHKFHFFMYLCTLEIAPLVILIKIILLKSAEM